MSNGSKTMRVLAIVTIMLTQSAQATQGVPLAFAPASSLSIAQQKQRNNLITILGLAGKKLTLDNINAQFTARSTIGDYRHPSKGGTPQKYQELVNARNALLQPTGTTAPAAPPTTTAPQPSAPSPAYTSPAMPAATPAPHIKKKKS